MTGEAAASVRAFVAIGLPPGQRAALRALGHELDRKCRGAKWVEEANLHLTIKFLGDVEAADLGRVEGELQAAAAGSGPFTMALGSLGAFPPRGAPRVLWVGLERGAAEAEAIFRRLDARLDEAGLAAREKRGFSAHITLARGRGGRGLVLKDDFFETHVPPEAAVPFRAEFVTLYKSELMRSGPRYEVIAKVPLPG